MMKYVLACIVMITFCLGFTLNGQNVAISIDHPNQVNAGEEFTVSVTITKGSLTDYSRFSQDLPLGLSAVNVSSPNADFSFDNQRIRIIWLKLPEGEDVTVSYKIMVDQRLKGSFVLGGVFAYVVEDERKFLNFDQSEEISIIPSPTLDPSLIVDIKAFKGGEAITPLTPESESYARAIRQRPVLQSSGEYLVKMLIQTPRSSKYLKIEENIPSGYLFEEVNSYNGIATLAPSTVKFIWMTLPEDPVFEIEYRLVPLENQPQEDMHIDGLFTHTVGDENKLDPIKQIDVNFEELNQNQKSYLLQTGQVPSGAGRTVQTVVQQTPVEPEPEPEPERPVTASDRYIENTRVLPPEQGFYYRVQVISMQTAIDAKTLFRSEGLDREVMVEEDGGMFKYTAGSFRTYEEADAYKRQIENVGSADGPFVVAYRDGRRVPVPLDR
jgi:hypothetical protein